nr:hypothetical protein [Tanacetum cinerariifolium]
MISALVLKLPPGLNLAALWHQQSSVLPQTRSLTSLGSRSSSISITIEPSTSKPHKKYKPEKQQPIEPEVPSPAPSLEYIIHLPSNNPIPNAAKDSMKFQELTDLCTRMSNKVLDLESEVIDIKFSFTVRLQSLKTGFIS